MAIPDTTTFSLQDVVTEINPTTDDLVDCFADAVSGSFDPSYSGSKNNLLNFRNYGAIPVLTLILSGNNFVIDNATVFQGFQMKFTYISQTSTGTLATIKEGTNTVSIGGTKTVTTVGGPGQLWNANALLGNPFTVQGSYTGIATITVGIEIISADTDTFPTGQITSVQNFTLQ